MAMIGTEGRLGHDLLKVRLAVTLGCNLLTIDRNVVGSLDADANLVAVNLDHRDDDIVAYDDLLTQLPAQNQHWTLPVVVESGQCDLEPVHGTDNKKNKSTSCASDLAHWDGQVVSRIEATA